MKPTDLVLPIAVAVAIPAAYFAGQYVARTEADQRFALAARLNVSSESAHRLFMAGAVADLLTESNTAEALRVTEQYAAIQAVAVQECLAQPPCGSWISTSSERRTRLTALVNRYVGQAPAAGSK